jgi:hypothetical protein
MYESIETLEHQAMRSNPYEGSPLSALDIPPDADFEVDTVPLNEIVDPDYYNVSKNAYAIVGRKLTGDTIFKVASNRYKPLLNRDIVNVLREVILESGLNLKDMQVTHTFSPDNAKYSCRIIFPNVTIEPKLNDIIHYGLNISNSYDLSWQFSSMTLAERLWCLNGCTTPDTTFNTRRKHTSSLHIEGEAQKLSNGIEAFYDTEGTYQRWINTPVSNFAVNELFTNTLAKYEQYGISKVAVKTLDDLMRDFRGQASNTLWSAYNVATAWATHVNNTRGGFKLNTQRTRHSKVATMLNSPMWKELSYENT